MRKYVLIVIAASLSFASCQWGAPKKKKVAVAQDTSVYTYQHYKKNAPDCKKTDSTCSIVDIKYPVFKDQNALNDTIIAKITSLADTAGKSSATLDAMSANFFKTAEEVKQERSDNEVELELSEQVSVVRQDQGLIAMQMDSYIYTGGAHADSPTFFINWDVKMQKNLKLDDILASGYQKPLNQIAEKIFRKEENLSETASLGDDYFFDNGKFRLNHNFLITPLGLRFLYNEYEIKPYAAGKTDILLPYNQIKSLLKPNTIVSQYAK